MFIPDTPVSSANEDTLGRKSFAEKLGATIRDWDRKESIVIALYGPWGSGKTSVLNMAVGHIEDTTHDRPKETQTIIIRFNPWNFSGQEQLLRAFFRELLAAIRKVEPNRVEDLQKLLNGFARILGALEKVPVAGDMVGAGKNVIDLFVGDEAPLEDLRKKISSLFESLNRRIVIVLDDIDRLTQEEIRQIFKLIKINADFPNTIYLVAFDRKVVEAALTSEQGVSGREYLEKIVQVGFDVPAADPALLSAMLTQELDRILSGMPDEYWDATRWGNLYHSGFKFLFTTIRDVKRYVNSLAFTFKIISNEVNPIDFMGLEAVRTFMPEIYTGIAGNKALFTQTVNIGFGTSVNRDSMKAQYEEIFAKAGDLGPIAKSICQQLFPQMRMAYANTHYGHEWQNTWRKERRICSLEMFDVYFLLGTPTGEVSKAELSEFLQVSNSCEALLHIFRKIAEEKRIGRLLELLEDMIDDLSKNWQTFCQALIILGEQLPDENHSMFRFGSDMEIARLVYRTLLKVEPSDRCEWFRDLIAQGDGMYMPAYLISLNDTEDSKPRENPLFDDACLQGLKTACVQSLAVHAQADRLSSAKNLGFILFRWRKWASDVTPLQMFIERLISTSGGVLDLVAGFAYPVRSQTAGDYVSKETWRIKLSTLSELVDLDKVKSMISSISKEELKELSPYRRRGLLALVTALQRQENGAQEDADFDD